MLFLRGECGHLTWNAAACLLPSVHRPALFGVDTANEEDTCKRAVVKEQLPKEATKLLDQAGFCHPPGN
jgi:hypothetical protein